MIFPTPLDLFRRPAIPARQPSSARTTNLINQSTTILVPFPPPPDIPPFTDHLPQTQAITLTLTKPSGATQIISSSLVFQGAVPVQYTDVLLREIGETYAVSESFTPDQAGWWTVRGTTPGGQTSGNYMFYIWPTVDPPWYLSTEDGEQIVTERGDYLVLEGGG